MKKLLSCFLVLLALLMLPLLGMEAKAVEIVDSGTCGENLTWTLDSDGLLTISGTGEMTNYDHSSPNYAPWYSLRKSVLTVVVDSGITSIGSNVFYDHTNLNSITIPNSVTHIGDIAFGNCKSISRVNISDITAWCNIDFDLLHSNNPLIYACNGLYLNGEPITSVELPDGVTCIPEFAFNNCTQLTRITIPNSVTSIGDQAFDGCTNLTNITIPKSVINIGDRVFRSCEKLTAITIPEGVTYLGYSLFEDCTNLSSIVIPDSVTFIYGWAFSGCTSLCSITIPKNVTDIDAHAFEKCINLRDITIPASVTYIGSNAFSGCNKLDTVHYTGTEDQKADLWIASNNQNLENALWHYECTGMNCPEPPPEEESKPTTPPAEEVKPTEPAVPIENPFTDVTEDAYYFNPILWAVSKGITNGLSENTFGPDATCTRGQIVTFLWRAKGSPEPQMAFNPFSDVSSSDYFYKAVLWAVEKGITSGMGDGTFAPGAPCTRGQVATFLWRSQGQPSVNGENIFTDIAPGAYYYDAVLWAVENSITNGMGDGTFAPDAPCTRGQIVTFLYRAMA